MLFVHFNTTTSTGPFKAKALVLREHPGDVLDLQVFHPEEEGNWRRMSVSRGPKIEQWEPIP